MLSFTSVSALEVDMFEWLVTTQTCLRRAVPHKHMTHQLPDVPIHACYSGRGLGHQVLGLVSQVLANITGRR